MSEVATTFAKLKRSQKAFAELWLRHGLKMGLRAAAVRESKITEAELADPLLRKYIEHLVSLPYQGRKGVTMDDVRQAMAEIVNASMADFLEQDGADQPVKVKALADIAPESLRAARRIEFGPAGHLSAIELHDKVEVAATLFAATKEPGRKKGNADPVVPQSIVDQTPAKPEPAAARKVISIEERIKERMGSS